MDRTLAAGHRLLPDGRRVFEDRDEVNGVRGTDTAAADQNAHQEEILNVILAGGLTPDAADLAQMARAIRNMIQGGMPPGAITAFAGTQAPALWLHCDGRAVSRTAYPDLFANIGVTYGGGNGSTTFNLPDLRGRAPIGLDALGFNGPAGRVTVAGSGIHGDTPGASGGSQSLAKHSHGVNDSGHGHGITDPGHGHAVNDPGHAHGVNDPGHGHNVTDPGHVHGIANDVSNDPGGGGFALQGQPGDGGVKIGAISTSAQATGIGVNTNGTGVSVNGAYSGIGVQPNGTGVAVNPNGTGISIYESGDGLYGNMPPALMVNYIIYAGA